MGAFDKLTHIFAGITDGIPAAIANSKAPPALKMQWAAEYATKLAALSAQALQAGWSTTQLQMQIDVIALNYISKLTSYVPPQPMPTPQQTPTVVTVPVPVPVPTPVAVASPSGFMSSLAQHKEQVIAGVLAIAGVALVAAGVRK